MAIFVTQEVSVIWKQDIDQKNRLVECSRIVKNCSNAIFIAKVINKFLRLFSTWTDFNWISVECYNFDVKNSPVHPIQHCTLLQQLQATDRELFLKE